MMDVVIKEKCGAKSLWLSLEAISQEVFCANKITRSSAVKLTYHATPHVCEFGKHSQHSRGSGGNGVMLIRQ